MLAAMSQPGQMRWVPTQTERVSGRQEPVLPLRRSPEGSPHRLRLEPSASPKTQTAYGGEALVRRVALEASAAATEAPILNPELAWDPGNRAGIEKFIREYGKGGLKYPKDGSQPLAVFDFDGTVIGAKRKSGELGDSGDALFLYMLSHGLFKMPASWEATSKWLTDEAVAVLKEASPVGPGDDYLPTRDNKALADAIFAIYNGKLPGSDKPAWKKALDAKSPHETPKTMSFGEAPNTMRPDYAWSMQLMAGYKPDELTSIIDHAVRVALSEGDSTLPIGTQAVNVRIRPHLQMLDLMQKLKDHGFKVVISSATYGPMVDAVAQALKIPVDHIIGSQPALDKAGRITPGFKACGLYPDNNQQIMNVGTGKRCGINEFNGVKDRMMQMHSPPNIALAGVDSDGDQGLFEFADGKVVVKRKGALLDLAAAQFGGPWWVNEPFEGP